MSGKGEPEVLQGQSIHLHAGEWVAYCPHGDSEVWAIHRGTRYLAWRSLMAHSTECEWVTPRAERP